MSTITPDHITIVSENKKVNQDDFEIIGRCCFIANIYPMVYRARIVGIIMKKGGGSGTIMAYDHVAKKELGRFDFEESEERPAMFELTDVPEGDPETYSAYISIQAKNNGQGFVEVLWAAFEVS